MLTRGLCSYVTSLRIPCAFMFSSNPTKTKSNLKIRFFSTKHTIRVLVFSQSSRYFPNSTNILTDVLYNINAWEYFLRIGKKKSGKFVGLTRYTFYIPWCATELVHWQKFSNKQDLFKKITKTNSELQVKEFEQSKYRSTQQDIGYRHSIKVIQSWYEY